MSDSFIHAMALEYAHACHEDDKESRYHKVTFSKRELPFLEDGEFVLVEYRRHKADTSSVTVTPDVVYAGI